MPLKIYYLASEIAPFSDTYGLGKFSREICSIFQENEEFDIRLIQPKYGYISERKFILREVIRLRDMPIVFDGKDRIGSVKSAFIPNTKVQVYFLEDDEFFKPVTNLLYKARNGRMLKDNPKRYAYFARVALENLKHLFWKPDIIIANDWQMSFVPALYKLQYADDEFYKDIKTVYLMHSASKENATFTKEAYGAVDLLDVKDKRLPKMAEQINNLELAMKFADKVIHVHGPDGRLDTELAREKAIDKLVKGTRGSRGLTIKGETPEDWTKAANTLETILRNL